ncbi:ABC transporter ATP-binding protein [Pseudomonadota bacterium]|nr:ABC transporter ATP-binding protein [Pseudomonadota bacterium]
MNVPKTLKVDKIFCEYEDRIVVSDIAFEVKTGGHASLLGPSGCGKTTILKAIAGFIQLTGGEISIDGKIVSGKTQFISPESRRVGMVFQEHALFPHLDVEKNIAVGLRKTKSEKKNKLIESFVERMGLGPERHKYPHELSGGQAQRVALARSLVCDPSVMLLDEPFSGLDEDLRHKLNEEVATILKERNITCLMVTHDQEEAFAFSDKVGVLNEGRLQQWATPHDIYHEPKTKFVADFIGEGVFLKGALEQDTSLVTDYVTLRNHKIRPDAQGSLFDVLLRPDDVIFDPLSPTKVRIISKTFKGSQTLYNLQAEGKQEIQALFPSHFDLTVGEMIGVRFDIVHVVAYQR